MDGTIKSVGQDFFEDGGMIRSQLTVESLPDDDGEDEDEPASLEDEVTEAAAEDLEEDLASVQEKVPEVPEVKEEKPKKKGQFGDFLDLMEVF